MITSLPQLSIQTFLNPFELYTDSREHGYQGPSRYVRLGRVTPPGGGTVARCWDGIRWAVTGKETLRILRVSEPSQATTDHKSATGRGGHRIDGSRNFWEGSGLKIDSASTDIAWGHTKYKDKILTSARNGELIMWDCNDSGVAKVDQRSKVHIRSIHKMAVSSLVDSYCITGSADGDMRVWDLRDISKSLMRVHHPSAVRSLVFSPSPWQTAQAVVGLDNGSLYRWDLRYGQRGQLDKLPVAHTGPITALDWCYPGPRSSPGMRFAGGQTDTEGSGMGWLVSGGLDRCVKVWDLTSPVESAHIPHKPTYTLHPSYPVRRIQWRPGYECELAIVSNAEYAMPSIDVSQAMTASNAQNINKPGLLTRVSSGLGLDSLMKSGAGMGDKLSMSTGGTKKADPRGSTISEQTTNFGDAVEIWDVRRAWIPKWSITGSAAEGGVTDISFVDSHALLTQNSSGAVVQLDLRDATKPVDAIPRVATTWEATGSMTFVVNDSEQQKWEVPYDDVNAEQSIPNDKRRKILSKVLGDPSARLTSQAMATFADDDGTEIGASDLETFTTLARRYIFEGMDKKDICLYNSQVALASGHETAAQIWLLLGACLAQHLPEVVPPAPAKRVKKIPSPLLPSQPHSQVQPSPQTNASMSGYAFPGPASTKKTDSNSMSLSAGTLPFGTPSTRRSTSDSISLSLSTSMKSPSFGQIPSFNSASGTPSRSLSRLPTSTSSASSSPRNIPTGLPPLTPRRASFFGRRESVDLGAVGVGVSRRPSLPATPARSSLASSPTDRNISSSLSLRNVGEGVLDESDSDSGSNQEGGDEESGEGEETAGAYSSDDERMGAPLRSTGSQILTTSRTFPTPSPLSRVAGKHSWTEDEYEESEIGRPPQRRDEDDIQDDDGYMPSSRSTDSESDFTSRLRSSSISSQKGSRTSKTRRRSSAHYFKARSRSSTVALLAVSQPPPLTHQDSHSSIRTVTAGSPGGEMSFKSRKSARQEKDDHAEVEYNPHSLDPRTSASHARAKSQTISELVSGTASKDRPQSVLESGQEGSVDRRNQLTERRIEAITFEERRLRETALSALRDALEDFSEQGDVQLCAMLALVAPTELKISQVRVTRFLDSYIEFLTRLRLYACAAYLRKYCDTEEIRKSTMLETTVYTSCGKCRKPLMLPAGSFDGKSLNKGSFSYCTGCKVSPIKCSICRLPVRTMLFQCGICNHGGHQACYRQYYLQKAMVDLPASFFPASNHLRGRTPLRQASSYSSVVEDDSASTISVQGSSAETASEANTFSTTTTVPNSTSDHFVPTSPVQSNSKTLVGHPCAVGCGHYCWAANANTE